MLNKEFSYMLVGDIEKQNHQSNNDDSLLGVSGPLGANVEKTYSLLDLNNYSKNS